MTLLKEKESTVLAETETKYQKTVLKNLFIDDISVLSKKTNKQFNMLRFSTVNTNSIYSIVQNVQNHTIHLYMEDVFISSNKHSLEILLNKITLTNE